MHLDDALLTAEGRIDPQRWMVAATGAPVLTIGDCPQHRRRVTAGEVSRDYHRKVAFYSVVCPAGHENVVPAGRVVRDPLSMPIFGVWANEALAHAARERDAAILGEHDELEPALA
jgi:hypothetical protein